MSTKKILIDMDGVITDLVTPAMRFMGVSDYKESIYPPGYSFDVVGACNKLREERGLEPVSDKEFWDSFTYDFWASLPSYTHSPALICAAKHLVGEENVFLATSPTLDPQCAAGKLAWVKQHAPSFIRRIMIGPRKELMANPYHALVDDSDKNVDAFRNAGGSAFLVPRPWNTLKDVTTDYFILFKFLENWALR